MIGSKAMALGEAARQLERWGLQGLWTGSSSLLRKEKNHWSIGGRGLTEHLQQEGSFCFFEKMLSEVTKSTLHRVD